MIWNQLEDMLGFILTRYFSNDEQLSRAILAVSGNQSRMDLLSYLVETKERDPVFAEGMRAFIKAFNICRENRNIAVHSTLRLTAPMAPAEWMEKPSKSAINKVVKYAYDISAMEQVQRDLLQTCSHGAHLISASILNEFYKTRPDARPKDRSDWRVPWPETPPQPRKLNPLPPPTDKGGIPPPPSLQE